MTQQHASNEFDAAKIIVEALKGLDQQQQDRALRFASESVGLQTPIPRSKTSPSSVPTATVAPDVTPPGVHNRQVDIKQFVESKSPRSDQQFATVVAYYYRFEAPAEQRKDAINADDLKNAVRLVGGRRQPGIPLATLNNAKNSGYLDSAGKGSFQINSVGENLVAITLPNKVKESVRANGGKKKTAKKHPSKKRAAKGKK